MKAMGISHKMNKMNSSEMETHVAGFLKPLDTTNIVSHVHISYHVSKYY